MVMRIYGGQKGYIKLPSKFKKSLLRLNVVTWSPAFCELLTFTPAFSSTSITDDLLIVFWWGRDGVVHTRTRAWPTMFSGHLL